MQTYHFDVVATGVNPHTDDFEQRFWNAGCDDALVSLRDGEVRISFSREAASEDEAIMSATDAVVSAGARIVRIDRE